MVGRQKKLWIAGVTLFVALGLNQGYRLGAMAMTKQDVTQQARPKGSHTNRLAQETSPYLLQHARNPVDWYPWDAEAFARAKEEDKPVFLSIGYSTCHWCHVMESESFEDEATAAVLNEHFIAIKVDREERPDVDATYMKAVQMLTGSGGWPLSVFLTPEGKPFYGGTYFPPEGLYGRPSFTQVLLAIKDAWAERREALLESSDKISETLRQVGRADAQGQLSHDISEAAYRLLSAQFDPLYGGFGRAPKFPQPSTLMLLLNRWRRTGDDQTLLMVTKTLDAMAAGGIYDHLGGGFHRYSTDARWLVPHFEKMLYDQALLSRLYLQAYQATGREAYAAVARDVFEYVLRDMTDPAGGFYAAEDADSEGREGVFYVWKQEEIETLLGNDAAGLYAAHFGVTSKGNFEDETNILHIAQTVDQLSEELDRDRSDMLAELTRAKETLFKHRSTRPRPHLDDKIITGWNGLMISSFAYGGAVLGDATYVRAAERAATFVLARLRADGRLMRYFRADKAIEKAFLDDHAAMVLGLLDLYEASFDPRWLDEAQTLADQMIELFTDEEAGGFYLAGRDMEQLVTRDKPSYDGAVPSGNSMAALALLRLHRITAEKRFGAAGQRVLKAFSGSMGDSPTGMTAMLLALDFHLGPTQEVVVVVGKAPEEAERLIQEVRRRFLPNAVLMLRSPGPDGDALARIAPFTANLTPIEGRAAAYVCENYTCRQPVTTPGDLTQILAEIPRED